MEAQLLFLMLKYEFWNKHRDLFIQELFSDNLSKLFLLITNHHDKHKKDLTLADLKVLYYYSYPSTTTAQWALIEKIINDIPGELSEDVAKEVIQKAWILEQARRVTNLGAEIINGKEADFAKIGKILKDIEQGSSINGDDLQPVSSDLNDIIAALDTTTKWQFNIHSLKLVASGIGPGIFCIAAGRVETGKSAFGISLCAAPDGFADQGAKCFFYCNEESPIRSQGRAVMSHTGMTLQEMLLDREGAVERFKAVRERIKFFDCRGRSIYELRKHIKKHSPDIAVIDQLDKVQIQGSFAREDERLGALYVVTRDIAIDEQLGIIALSQLNAEADGKTYIGSSNLANARTSKAAEGDLVFGIGKSPGHDDNSRVINVIKNKISGNHQDVPCLIRPEISRYIV